MPDTAPTPPADYRWWLTAGQVPADWHAKVAFALHSGGRDQCDCDAGDEHQFLLDACSDDAAIALEAAVPLAAGSEKARILALLDAWRCPCGADDCAAYDTRDQIAALIGEDSSDHARD